MPSWRAGSGYLLDLARLLHQKHYRQRRYRLAELSVESKGCSADYENDLTYQLAPCRAEKPRARAEGQPAPCPDLSGHRCLGRTSRTQAVSAGDVSVLQDTAMVTTGLTELVAASRSSHLIKQSDINHVAVSVSHGAARGPRIVNPLVLL